MYFRFGVGFVFWFVCLATLNVIHFRLNPLIDLNITKGEKTRHDVSPNRRQWESSTLRHERPLLLHVISSPPTTHTAREREKDLNQIKPLDSIMFYRRKTGDRRTC